MNRTLLLGAALLVAGSAMAEWGTSASQPTALFPSGTTSYATELKAASDGSVWAMIYHPNLADAEDEYDTSRVVYEFRLQRFDSNGNPTFPEEGILLSDYANWSYTVVTDYMLADSEGNAVVAVPDCRNSPGSEKSITVYKVSPEGEMLWGEEGKALSDPMNPAELTTCIRMVELEDGSYVFAWCEFHNNVPTVCLQRMSRDGETLWEGAGTGTGSDYAQYPYLVNSGDNTCILVYAATASQVLYARKLDFEGESVWGKDVRIYRGGWGSIPMHTLVNVRPSGNGGVLVAWSDDRANTQVESAYISYVTPDGKLGFAGVSDEGDCKLCYDGWRCFSVDVVPAGDGSAFYAVWRRTDNPQRMQGVKMQKVSLDGELLWGDDAKELCPTDFYSTGYISLQPDDNNGACCFYEIYREYFDQQCFAARFDSEGELVWPDASVALSVPARKASSLQSQPYGENAWLCNWDDGGTQEDKSTTYVMALLYDDGCLGKPGTGLTDISADNAALSYRAGSLHAAVADGCKAVVYTPTGVKAAEAVFKGGSATVRLRPGLYMAAAEGCATIKFVVEQ